ncbi:MAG: alpha/beta hydrolase [Microscillaceae bacterium]|nr:alpha/beta hydrolase [Microscillaceae bacterium]
MMQEKEFSWKNEDLERIYAKDWHVENARAVLALVHGLGEHCNRYGHLAKYFASNNIATVAYDHIGHGKSEGKRGHVKSFSRYMHEIDTLLEEIQKRYLQTPVFLYGHSMGGNLVLNYVLRHQPDIKGVIATGSWIQLPPGKEPKGLFLAIIKLVRKIYPSLAQSNGLNPAHLARVEDVIIDYKNDPLTHDRISVNAALEMLAAAKYLNQFEGRVSIPTLIMHGSEDHITACAGSEQFAKRAQGDISLKAWEKFYHEIHNEAEKKEVFMYTWGWMERFL